MLGASVKAPGAALLALLRTRAILGTLRSETRRLLERGG